MERRQIIPLAPADRGKPGVAVEVKQTGSHPLDVRLLGSEGEFPYVATSKIVSICCHIPPLTSLSSQTAQYFKL
jgi:hypothetical protein